MKSEGILKWSLILLIFVGLTGWLGYGREGGAASGIAQVLFWVFTVLFLLSIYVGSRRRK